jgi:hypothetical protein
MEEEPDCCQRKVVWLVMVLCALLAVVLLAGY